MKNIKITRWFGVISLLFYTLAVLITPLTYPNYQWMTQAVSDLSARSAPSFYLWNILSFPYIVFGLLSVTRSAINLSKSSIKCFNIGLFCFALMQWISAIGYSLFPLSEPGYNGQFQDFVHTYIVTSSVVLLSIVSLILIILSTYKSKSLHWIALMASLAFLMMLIGAIGTSTADPAYFGLFERFSVFSVVLFNAFLGWIGVSQKTLDTL